MLFFLFFFFFKQKTAYEMRISDWSSDVCSSDLPAYLCQRRGSCGNRIASPCSAQTPEGNRGRFRQARRSALGCQNARPGYCLMVGGPLVRPQPHHPAPLLSRTQFRSCPPAADRPALACSSDIAAHLATSFSLDGKIVV